MSYPDIRDGLQLPCDSAPFRRSVHNGVARALARIRALDALEQIVDRTAKAVTEAEDRRQARIAVTALETRDLGCVDPAVLGEILLRHVATLAKPSEVR